MNVPLLLDRLFTNGTGQIADRLVLESKDGRDLGGWCRGAIRDQIADLLPGSFFVGQRVQMTKEGRDTFPSRISYTGIVTRVGPSNLISVKRDGYRSRPFRFGTGWWEPVPVDSLPHDQAADMLVAAYLAGERTAALALADHLMELHGGTKRDAG